MTPLRRLGSLVAVLALTAAACGNGDGRDAATTTSPPSTSTTTSTTIPPLEPGFVDAPCPMPVNDAPPVRCGTVEVEGDRSNPGASTVTLAVAVIETESPERRPDPIVYFSGGPGYEALDIVAFFQRVDLGRDRDVVVFDQRGTGRSEPSLDCPEVEEAIWQGFATADDPLVELGRAVGPIEECRDRLRGDDVDLANFSTPVTADDADDVRRALGYDTWNLFGVSYGTTVAIEVLRRHPDHVRSAVLDSIYPPDIANDGTRLADNAERAFTQLFDACADDSACVETHGDLAVAFDELVADWDERPFESSVTDPVTGEERPLALTGGDLVAGLFNAMYDENLIGVLPSLFAPLRDRDGAADAIVGQLATDGVGFLIDASEGVAIGVDCADRQHLGAGTDDVEAVVRDRPRYGVLAVLAAIGTRCDAWDVPSVDRPFNTLPTTTVPVLGFGNEFDPVTPPGDSERVTEALGGTFVFAPSLGHGAVFAHPCTADIFQRFIADPAATVDDACTDVIAPPVFAAG